VDSHISADLMKLLTVLTQLNLLFIGDFVLKHFLVVEDRLATFIV